MKKTWSVAPIYAEQKIIKLDVIPIAGRNLQIAKCPKTDARSEAKFEDKGAEEYGKVAFK